MNAGGIKVILIVVGAVLSLLLINYWTDIAQLQDRENKAEQGFNKSITFNKHSDIGLVVDENNKPVLNIRNDANPDKRGDFATDNVKSSTSTNSKITIAPDQNRAATSAPTAPKLPPLPPGLTLNDIPEEYSNNIDVLAERLENIKNNPSTDERQNELADPIYFSSLTPDLISGVPNITSAFSPYCYRIYATFTSNTANFQNKAGVLVKWHNSEQIVLGYEYYQLVPGANYNFVWREMPYWDTGIHNVEIYELENNVRLLASGSFFIEDLAEYIAYPALYSSPQQLNANTVYYENDDIYLRLAYSSLTGVYLNMSVYKLESRETVLDQKIVLSASKNDMLKIYIKRASDILPYGTYNLDLTSENKSLVGRTTFYINQD